MDTKIEQKNFLKKIHKGLQSNCDTMFQCFNLRFLLTTAKWLPQEENHDFQNAHSSSARRDSQGWHLKHCLDLWMGISFSSSLLNFEMILWSTWCDWSSTVASSVPNSASCFLSITCMVRSRTDIERRGWVSSRMVLVVGEIQALTPLVPCSPFITLSKVCSRNTSTRSWPEDGQNYLSTN